MPYKDPEKNKEARKKSADKTLEKRLTIYLPRSLALYEPMKKDMEQQGITSESEYMIKLLCAELEKKGLWTAPPSE